jgi:hypothetical protein
MLCTTACEHNVARLVTGGLGRRFLATSPAGDQAPAFGVLQATEAKSHLPDFDLVRCCGASSGGYISLISFLLGAHAVAGRTRTG